MNEYIFILQPLRKCLKEYVMIREISILNSGNQTIYHDYVIPMTLIIYINILLWAYPGQGSYKCFHSHFFFLIL